MVQEKGRLTLETLYVPTLRSAPQTLTPGVSRSLSTLYGCKLFDLSRLWRYDDNPGCLLRHNFSVKNVAFIRNSLLSGPPPDAERLGCLNGLKHLELNERESHSQGRSEGEELLPHYVQVQMTKDLIGQDKIVDLPCTKPGLAFTLRLAVHKFPSVHSYIVTGCGQAEGNGFPGPSALGRHLNREHKGWKTTDARPGMRMRHAYFRSSVRNSADASTGPHGRSICIAGGRGIWRHRARKPKGARTALEDRQCVAWPASAPKMLDDTGRRTCRLSIKEFASITAIISRMPVIASWPSLYSTRNSSDVAPWSLRSFEVVLSAFVEPISQTQPKVGDAIQQYTRPDSHPLQSIFRIHFAPRLIRTSNASPTLLSHPLVSHDARTAVTVPHIRRRKGNHLSLE